MVLPGPRCPLRGLVPLPLPAEGSLSGTAPGLSCPPRPRPCPPVSPGPLPGLALLQGGLGCALVALSLAAPALSGAPQVQNACPPWAGCSVGDGTRHGGHLRDCSSREKRDPAPPPSLGSRETG